jgi:hypothetical protein
VETGNDHTPGRQTAIDWLRVSDPADDPQSGRRWPRPPSVGGWGPSGICGDDGKKSFEIIACRWELSMMVMPQ